MSADVAYFVNYLIYETARAWEKSPIEVYKTLEKSGAIGDYLAKNYEVLHTQGTPYLTECLEKYLSLRGIKI